MPSAASCDGYGSPRPPPTSFSGLIGTSCRAWTLEGLQGAAMSFQWRTTQTFDGLHPRQLGDFPDVALEVLAVSLQAVEVSGIWPP